MRGGRNEKKRVKSKERVIINYQLVAENIEIFKQVGLISSYIHGQLADNAAYSTYSFVYTVGVSANYCKYQFCGEDLQVMMMIMMNFILND